MFEQSIEPLAKYIEEAQYFNVLLTFGSKAAESIAKYRLLTPSQLADLHLEDYDYNDADSDYSDLNEKWKEFAREALVDWLGYWKLLQVVFDLSSTQMLYAFLPSHYQFQAPITLATDAIIEELERKGDVVSLLSPNTRTWITGDSNMAAQTKRLSSGTLTTREIGYEL